MKRTTNHANAPDVGTVAMIAINLFMFGFSFLWVSPLEEQFTIRNG
jgi:hypothetical protein